ncbi:IclR family transcriptional regulator [Planosporangium mesophilum]|nr:IclR family transcriptional regulator [Planosporangium mesophilum]NJC82946.1 IclR family transcriptional regulator [Planosporangium mesophilum]
MRTTQSSLLRALHLLDAFRPGVDELTLGDLARHTGVPKTTAHRMVADLVEWGALERTPTGLRLGMRLFELGHLVPAQRGLRDLALPYLEDLYETTHQTVNLAVRHGNEIVYVEKLVSRGRLVPHSRTGGRLPLHCTALGKAILAFSPPHVVDEVIAAGLRPITSKSITDAARLLSDLAAIRERRVAFDVEESRLGMFCAASPLVNAKRVPVGALSITGMDSMSTARRFAPAVLTAALSLSRRLDA